MEYINITLPSGQIITTAYLEEYNKEKKCGTYIFEKDINVGEWSIRKIIKDFHTQYYWNSYMEFVITDRTGKDKILKYFYYSSKDDVPSLALRSNENPIAHYIKYASLFRREDWSDYHASVTIKAIERILTSDMNYINKSKQIINLLKDSIKKEKI